MCVNIITSEVLVLFSAQCAVFHNLTLWAVNLNCSHARQLQWPALPAVQSASRTPVLGTSPVSALITVMALSNNTYKNTNTSFVWASQANYSKVALQDMCMFAKHYQTSLSLGYSHNFGVLLLLHLSPSIENTTSKIHFQCPCGYLQMSTVSLNDPSLYLMYDIKVLC